MKRSRDARGDLTDDRWLRLESVLPPLAAMGRKPRDRWQVFDGIWWRARTGSPWRDIPQRYGPWETAYSVFRRWQIDGTWARILEKLQVKADAAGHIEWEVSVDSTVCRAHQHAAGARKRGLIVQAGRPRTAWRPSRTYSSREIREYLRRRQLPHTIPEKRDQAGHRLRRGSAGGRPPGFDREKYKARHKVECRIGLLKQARGVATRYDKLAVRYEATSNSL
ncbi:IS5 family transposase [Streptomyces marokkonensis]|uniref:IS5 family transposase n=1 Tax=Streptomyces marokkonensis TaxID=324855 RepID=UPI0031F1A123